MPTFIAWDHEGTTEADGAEVVEAPDSSTAAEMYAEQDVDGEMDGIYRRGGRVIAVKDEAGAVMLWDVEVEYQPTYYASEHVTEEQRRRRDEENQRATEEFLLATTPPDNGEVKS